MSKTLIVGNKNYKNLDIGVVIDSFDSIKRCNMSLPMGKNGTKFGSLGLCCHLYTNLIVNPITKNEFYKKYHMYKEKEIDIFFENFDISKFNSCYYEQSDISFSNSFLSAIGCPHRFAKQPRTGYASIIDSLTKKNQVVVCGFTIVKEETRDSWYVKENMGDSECHDSASEIEVLRWLHANNIVDASLCLLKDEETISFIENDLKPTPFIMELLELHYNEENTIRN